MFASLCTCSDYIIGSHAYTVGKKYEAHPYFASKSHVQQPQGICVVLTKKTSTTLDLFRYVFPINK